MGVGDRPYAGGWKQNQNSVVRHTPDARVFFNGMLTLPGCPACHGSVDVQKYITGVSVDTSVEPVANCTISMSVPRFASDVFGQDGSFIITPGIEVVVYMRGYFPIAGGAVTPGWAEGVVEGEINTNEVVAYPYYQVFRGIVIEASHDYNGGMYNASLTCADFLHFWQNLQLATNGAVLQNSTNDSSIQGYMTGHRFTRMNPYAIIYTLFKVGYGSTGGADYIMSGKTNHDATAWKGESGTQLNKLAALNMERILASHQMSLKMFAMDGTLYSAMEMAFIGTFHDDQSQGSQLWENAGADHGTVTGRMLEFLRKYGFNSAAANAQLLDSNEGGDAAYLNILKQNAFMMDIGALGALNLWETEYMTKLEIGAAVTDITGFELYMDVDGDIVFKPPFWNMDTSSDPTYRIENRDLISLSQASREPEATYVKVTGTHFNAQGTGTDGWVAPGATYIDYRLVGMFGWREHSFEAGYLSSAKQMYISAIARLDVINVGTHTCSATIPIRPELRPGYPVYITEAQCFYYIQSLSHQFQFGGQCTTTINGTARRGKFHPPGTPPKDRPVAISDIRLDRPDLPALPILASGQGGETASQTFEARTVGFPNVVMALDPSQQNIQGWITDPFTQLELGGDQSVWAEKAVIEWLLTKGYIEADPENAPSTDLHVVRTEGPWKFRTSNTDWQTIRKAEITEGYAAYAAAGQALSKAREGDNRTGYANAQRMYIEAISGPFGTLIGAIKKDDLNKDEALRNWIALLETQKARWAPKAEGRYRYYSSSHPDPAHQGPDLIRWDKLGGTMNLETPRSPESSGKLHILKDGGTAYPLVEEISASDVERGLTVMALDSDGEEATQAIILTSELHFVNFCYHTAIPNPTRLVGAKGQDYLAGFFIDTGRLEWWVRVIRVNGPNAQAAENNPKAWFYGDSGDPQTGFDSLKPADGVIGALFGLMAEAGKQMKTPSGKNAWESIKEGAPSGARSIKQDVETFFSAETGFMGLCGEEDLNPNFTLMAQYNACMKWTPDKTDDDYAECVDPSKNSPNWEEDAEIGYYNCGCVFVSGLKGDLVVDLRGTGLECEDRSMVDANRWGFPVTGWWVEPHNHGGGNAQNWYSRKFAYYVQTAWDALGRRYMDLLKAEGMKNDTSWEHPELMNDAFDAKQEFYDQIEENFGGDDFEIGQGIPDFAARQVMIRYASDEQLREEEPARLVPSPVFPVSDNEGFEVIGSQAYGRGLNVLLYSDLVAATGFDSSRVVVGNGDTGSQASFQAAEEFLWTFATQSRQDPAAALSAMKNKDASTWANASMALGVAGVDVPMESWTLDHYTAGIKPATTVSAVTQVLGKTERALSNHSTDSDGAYQSLVAGNIPVAVAEITAGAENVCACRGFQGEIYMAMLQDSTGLALASEGPMHLSEDLDADALIAQASKLEAWWMSKDALAGRHLDTERTNIATMISDTFGAGGQYDTMMGISEETGLRAGAVEAKERYHQLKIEIEATARDIATGAVFQEPEDVVQEEGVIATTEGESGGPPMPGPPDLTYGASSTPGYDLGDD